MYAKRSTVGRRDVAGLRRLGRSLAALGLIMAVFGVLPHSANAADSEDPRATRHGGNVTTCAGVGLGSDSQLGAEHGDAGSADGIVVTNDGTFLQVTNGGNEVIDVIVVKGGPAYNVYPGTVLTSLRAPLNNGGNIPGISHWFICYHAGEVTTTTAEVTTTTAEPTTTTAEVTTTTAEVTTTTAEPTTTTAEPTTTTAEVTTTTAEPTTTTAEVTTTTAEPTTTTEATTTTTETPTTAAVLPSTTEATTTTDPADVTTTTSKRGVEGEQVTKAVDPAVGAKEVARNTALPRTGSDTTPLLVAGVGLVLIGALVSRRASVMRR